MGPGAALHFEIEKSTDQSANRVTTIRCQGKLVSDTVPQMKELIKSLIPIGGRIVLDLSDLSLLDSSGLGALVSLKASAIKQGSCTLQLVNITPRILDLLRVTSLTQLFSS
jgi:anti-anti-sigma factor